MSENPEPFVHYIPEVQISNGKKGKNLRTHWASVASRIIYTEQEALAVALQNRNGRQPVRVLCQTVTSVVVLDITE